MKKFANFSTSQSKKFFWSVRASISPPLECESSALPNELTPHIKYKLINITNVQQYWVDDTQRFRYLWLCLKESLQNEKS